MPEDMSPAHDNSTSELTEFFETIWGSENVGLAYLPTRDIKTATWKKVFYKWPEHTRHIVKHVQTASAQGLDVFFAPALFSEPKVEKKYALGSKVLWADFDGRVPVWASDSLDPRSGTEDHPDPERLSTPRPDAPATVPEPNVRVQSSTEDHEHVYWTLDEFVTDIQWIEDCNRSIAYTLRADTSGWDINQILRPPFSTNQKHHLPVTLRNVDRDALFPRTAFKELKPALKLVTDSIDTDNLPQVEAIIAKFPWNDEHFKLFMASDIEEGHRSDALMRLGYFCAEIGMSDVEAYAVLENADGRWKKYVGRNDRKRRLVDIINRARQKHPVGITELVFRGLSGQSETVTDLQTIYGFQDFLQTDFHFEWAIEDLLESTGFGTVVSLPGVGKTQFSIQLGISLALGKSFLDWKVPKPLKVAVLSLEMSHIALKKFMATMAQEYSPEELVALNDQMMVIPIGQGIALDTPEGFNYICTLLDEIQPDGLIIDSMGKLTDGDLNRAAVTKLNNRYLSLRARYGCFLWFVHHSRKASGENSKPTSLSDVYGDAYITAEMTCVLTLWKDTDGTIEISTVKSRLAEERKPFKVRRNKNLHLVEENKFAEALTLASRPEAPEESAVNDDSI